MQKAQSHIKHIRSFGFAAVELLLAATIFGFLTVGVIGAIVYGREATANSGEYERAIFVAEEGVEAVRNIRDAGFANLSDGTYGLVQSGNQWTLSGSTDVSNGFTRQVSISTVDASRKNVSVAVSWAYGSVNRNTTLATRFANWRAALTPTVSWNNPILSGSTTLGNNNNGIKVATQGNYAYIVMQSGSPNLYVVDVSNSSSPVVTGSASIASNPRNIVVDGNFAYIASTNNATELQVVNISNPTNPALVASYDAPGNADAYGIRKEGNFVYMSRLKNGSNKEFNIFNVTNPLVPVLTGSYGINQHMRDLCVIGNYTYLGTDNNSQEIIVMNTTNKSVPVLVTNVNLAGGGRVNALRCFNNTVFAAQTNAIKAVNVTVPNVPIIAGNITPNGAPNIYDIGAKEDSSYLYLATDRSNGEFEVIDATVIANMTSLSTVDMPGGVRLYGVAYNPMLNIVVGASTSNSQEFSVFRPN